MCAKLCCLTNAEVKLPENTIPSDICFTNDGALLFVDEKGYVYQASGFMKLQCHSYKIVDSPTVANHRLLCTPQVDLEENKAVRQTWNMPCETGVLMEEEEFEPSEGGLPACYEMLHPCMTFSKTGVIVFEPPSKLKVNTQKIQDFMLQPVKISFLSSSNNICL